MFSLDFIRGPWKYCAEIKKNKSKPDLSSDFKKHNVLTK